MLTTFLLKKSSRYIELFILVSQNWPKLLAQKFRWELSARPNTLLCSWLFNKSHVALQYNTKPSQLLMTPLTPPHSSRFWPSTKCLSTGWRCFREWCLVRYLVSVHYIVGPWLLAQCVHFELYYYDKVVMFSKNLSQISLHNLRRTIAGIFIGLIYYGYFCICNKLASKV